MDEFSMAGFYSDPFGPINGGDIGLGSSISIDDVAALSLGDAIGGSVFATGDSILGGAKSLADWGLKATETGLNMYGKFQDQDLNRYVKTSQVEIAKTNALTAQDTAKLLGQAKVQSAQALANAARSGAGLTAMGQNPNSLMLYLTILGVVFAAIQVMNSAK